MSTPSAVSLIFASTFSRPSARPITLPPVPQARSDEQRQQSEFESLEIEAAVVLLKRELAEARRGEEVALQSARQQAKAHHEALEALRKQARSG